MSDRHYQLEEDQLRSAEGCVRTIAEALDALGEPSSEQEASLRQIREANLLVSQILRDIQTERPTLRPLGARVPPKESNELAERGKKGPLY